MTSQTNYLMDLGIAYFEKTPTGEKINEYITSFEKYQMALCTLNGNVDGEKNQAIRIGTTLTFGIANKLATVKKVRDFSEKDWKEISDTVIDIGILMDGALYSRFVFEKYADYIDLSVDLNGNFVDEKSAKAIRGLSNELRVLGVEFTKGCISEPDYVDRCLWICFEAIIKLLSLFVSATLPDEYKILVRGISEYSVQFARYMMYEKERALLDEYLEKQHELDAELEQKYRDFIEELELESNRISELIEDAFNPDFRNKLHGSAKLAEAFGVDESELLETVNDVDDFFM